AFFAVGIPGLLMALWVWTLKEPQRGASEGIVTPDDPEPFRGALEELRGILPPLHFLNFIRLQAPRSYFLVNLIALAVILGGGYLLVQSTGSLAQWVALGIGVYAAFSWAQSLALRDRATFEMIFKTRTLLYCVIAFPTMSFVTYGVGFWGPPFFQRIHGVSASEAGIVLGLSAAVGGWLGVTLGGVIADMLRTRTSRGKIYIGLASVFLSAPTGVALLTTDDLTTAYVLNFIFAVTSPMWVGPGAATVNDLVMPRMRAMASAFYLLMVTFIGLALGPYLIGQISDTLTRSGTPSAEALQTGMLTGLGIYLLSLVMFILAALNVEQDEGSRIERARALGEVVD
ncbi:MAG: hypothetical protein KDI36_14455, partial [Pseudomonadales bacterium]|nr:hypothetical protein [Pseudomonadales bacterium]